MHLSDTSIITVPCNPDSFTYTVTHRINYIMQACKQVVAVSLELLEAKDSETETDTTSLYIIENGLKCVTLIQLKITN